MLLTLHSITVLKVSDSVHGCFSICLGCLFVSEFCLEGDLPQLARVNTAIASYAGNLYIFLKLYLFVRVGQL